MAAHATGGQHLDSIIGESQRSAAGGAGRTAQESPSPDMGMITDAVAGDNVLRVVKELPQ